jgi:hypothetical protein
VLTRAVRAYLRAGGAGTNDLKDHAALALGNVAIGSAAARDHVIECGGTAPLLAVMKEFVAGASTSARVLNSTVWTVRTTTHHFLQARPCAPVRRGTPPP